MGTITIFVLCSSRSFTNLKIFPLFKEFTVKEGKAGSNLTFGKLDGYFQEYDFEASLLSSIPVYSPKTVLALICLLANNP